MNNRNRRTRTRDQHRSDSYDVELLLDVLGNPTRRKILKLLSDEPRYFNQLARDTQVSQQAIMRHLNMMEKSGLIISYDKKSDLGAPDRKYYKLNKSLNLVVDLSEDVLKLEIREIQRQISREYDDHRMQNIYCMFKELEESDLSDLESTVKHTDSIMTEIDKEMRDLQDKRAHLLKLRQEVMNKIHSSIRSNLGNELQRKIMYSITDVDDRTKSSSISEIASSVDAGEVAVREMVADLGKRFSTNTKRKVFGKL